MIQTPKHGPLPFKMVHPKGQSRFIDIFDNANNSVVTCFGSETVNAEFITRACNSHYQLVDALEDVLNDLKSRSKWDEDVKTIPLGCGAFARAEEALALAKGESN